MHEELWAGIEAKQEFALFHHVEMSRALDPPQDTAYTVALLTSGAVIGNNWRLRLYANLSASLSAVRSIPEIINCCFGEDRGGPEMGRWFDALPSPEQARRREFSERFRPHLLSFRELMLSKARIDSDHRFGVTAAEGKITGIWGETYLASATKNPPLTETRTIGGPLLGHATHHFPLRPMWDGFTLDGQQLFPLCMDYINRAQALIGEAHRIADEVHKSEPLTPPPSKMVREPSEG